MQVKTSIVAEWQMFAANDWIKFFLYKKVYGFSEQSQTLTVKPEDTHRWGKDESTAGLQF